MSLLVRSLVLVAALALLAACTQPQTPRATPSPAAPTVPSPTGTTEGLVGPIWLATEVHGRPLVPGTTISAHFGADGTLSGSDGCNHYTGGYTVSGGTIRVDESLASTLMACDPEIMDQARAYVDVLKSAPGFTVEGDRLVLTGEDGAVAVSFAIQDLALVDGTWTVTGYNDGQEAVTSVLEGTHLTATFAADGPMTGAAGCNSFHGTFTSSGDTLAIGPLAVTQMACTDPPGVMKQESRLLAALESAATYAIEGDVLQIRTADEALAVTFTRG